MTKDSNLSERGPDLNFPLLPIAGKDQDHDACRSLWVAVIEKAIKDVAYVHQKRQKGRLTPSEREKLNRIYELDTPESFFDSAWFEDICLLLGLPPARIRSVVTERYLQQASQRTLLV